MNKLLLIVLLCLGNTAFAEKTKKFPQDISGYHKNMQQSVERPTNATIELILFDKKKMDVLSLNNQDLINDTEKLTGSIVDFFKTDEFEKVIDEKEKNKGYLLISKYFFVGKQKPFKIESKADMEKLQSKIEEQSQCKKGFCVSQLIMGINYFNEDLTLKNLDIKSFTEKLKKEDFKFIKVNKKNAKEGVVRVLYFYGINGSVLPKDKNSIKKMIEISRN